MTELRRWYEMARAQASDTAVIRIFGDIGESWWGDSVSASSFAQELDALGSVSALEIRLNSPGGDMFDGVAIYNTLRSHAARKVMYVDGLAASAASVIAMAADELVMGTGTQLMIHNAWAFIVGDANDMRKQAGVMDGLNESMARIYADRAGGAAETWRAAMDEETWYLPEEAVAAGLADRVVKREPDANGGNLGNEGDVAAMLRSSPAARKFRYQGRAQAPAPTTPVVASNAKGGSVEITDEDFTALRTKLGLPEDAAIADVLDALDEEQDEDAAAAKAAPAPKAGLPEGVLAIDKDTLTALQADAALGRKAREEQVTARQRATVDAAVKAGKITPARREHWLSQLASDEEGIGKVIEGLTPVFQTDESGYDDGSEAPAALGNVAAVRELPAYKNWSVV